MKYLNDVFYLNHFFPFNRALWKLLHFLIISVLQVLEKVRQNPCTKKCILICYMFCKFLNIAC